MDSKGFLGEHDHEDEDDPLDELEEEHEEFDPWLRLEPRLQSYTRLLVTNVLSNLFDEEVYEIFGELFTERLSDPWSKEGFYFATLDDYVLRSFQAIRYAERFASLFNILLERGSILTDDRQFMSLLGYRFVRKDPQVFGCFAWDEAYLLQSTRIVTSIGALDDDNAIDFTIDLSDQSFGQPIARVRFGPSLSEKVGDLRRILSRKIITSPRSSFFPAIDKTNFLSLFLEENNLLDLHAARLQNLKDDFHVRIDLLQAIGLKGPISIDAQLFLDEFLRDEEELFDPKKDVPYLPNFLSIIMNLKTALEELHDTGSTVISDWHVMRAFGMNVGPDLLPLRAVLLRSRRSLGEWRWEGFAEGIGDVRCELVHDSQGDADLRVTRLKSRRS